MGYNGPTVEGLQKIADYGSSINRADTEQAILNQQFFDMQDRKKIAQQASGLFKQGDVKGAYSLLMSDPEFAAKNGTQVSSIVPDFAKQLTQGKTTGELEGQNQYGSTPRQITDANNDTALKVAALKAKAAGSKGRVLKDPNSPTGFTVVSPDGTVMPVDQYSDSVPNSVKKLNPGINGDQSVTAPDQTPQAPKLRANEDIDSSGQKVLLSPEQQKMIKDARKSFDSETKKIVEGLESAHSAQSLIESNNAGGEPLERLRLLRTVSPRPTQQEFQAFGADMGAIDSLENKLQKIGNGKMTPEIQKDYLNIVNLMSKKLDEEYHAHLNNTLERNPKVDPMILKKHLIGSSGPTAYQNIIKQVQSLPPEGQAIFNWAHDNPSDPRAQHYLKQLSEKYKLGQ